MRVQIQASIAREAKAYTVVSENKEVKVQELNLPLHYSYPSGDYDYPKTAKQMYAALYDLVNTHDELKDGDTFKTKFGTFEVKGPGIFPHDDALQALNAEDIEEENKRKGQWVIYCNEATDANKQSHQKEYDMYKEWYGPLDGFIRGTADGDIALTRKLGNGSLYIFDSEEQAAKYIEDAAKSLPGGGLWKYCKPMSYPEAKNFKLDDWKPQDRSVKYEKAADMVWKQMKDSGLVEDGAKTISVEVRNQGQEMAKEYAEKDGELFFEAIWLYLTRKYLGSKASVASVEATAGAAYEFNGYLESRRFNAKLYHKVGKEIVQKLNEYLGAENTAKVEFGMSAKYQTPYVILSGIDDGRLYNAADVVAEVLDEYFSSPDIDDDRDGEVKISFRD